MRLEIQCADCGDLAPAPNRLTKYCTTCQLARAVEWHDNRTSKCGCGREYIAWTGKKSSRRCGECLVAAGFRGRESMDGTCSLKTCREERVLYSKKVPVCYPCLYRPANADLIRKTILTNYEYARRPHANQDGV